MEHSTIEVVIGPEAELLEFRTLWHRLDMRRFLGLIGRPELAPLQATPNRNRCSRRRPKECRLASPNHGLESLFR